MNHYRYRNITVRNKITPKSTNIDENDFKLTPLYKEIINNNEESAIKLINNGVRINYENKLTINTPFGLALRYKCYNVINELLNKDLYINIQDDILLKEAFTELNIDQLTKLSDILFKEIQNISYIQFNKWFDKYNYKNLYILLKKGFTLENQHHILNTILNDRVNNDLNSLYDTLFYLSKNIKMRFRDSILYYALINNQKMAERLINDGCQLDYSQPDEYQIPNKDNEIKYKKSIPSPLIFSEKYQHKTEPFSKIEQEPEIDKKCKELINIYNNIDMYCKDDPLILACILNYTDIVKLLLSKNVPINKCYKNALYYAVINNNNELINLLQQKGLSLNDGITDIEHSYALSMIIKSENDLALRFIKNGENIDYKIDNFDKSLLFILCYLNVKYYTKQNDDKILFAKYYTRQIENNFLFKKRKHGEQENNVINNEFKENSLNFYPLCKYLFDFYKDKPILLDFVRNELKIDNVDSILNNCSLSLFINSLRKYILKKYFLDFNFLEDVNI